MKNYSNCTDAELLHYIAQQDEEALSELYSRYCDLVYSFARHTLQDTGLAEEVTQDIFLKIWRRQAEWRPDRGRFISWLLTITRYTAIDRLRKELRRPVQVAMFSGSNSDSLHTNSYHDDPDWQDGQALRKLLAQLPKEQAQVIELGFFQGMTHSEIAEFLHLPLGTVKGRSRLGLLKLKSLWLELIESETSLMLAPSRLYNKGDEAG